MQQSLYVQAGELRMHCLHQGEGEPTLLIHGFPETSHEWTRLMPLLADRWSLYAIDTRGHGRTEKPTDHAGYTRLALASDIVRFMDAMNWSKANVVAHDWGGIIASKMALDFGDRISRLALLDTITTGWPTFVDYYYWMVAPGRADTFFKTQPRTFIETMFLGESDPPCPPPPASPWNMPRELIAPAVWATPNDIAHYVKAMAASAANDVDLHYYRNLRFHRVIADPTAPRGERYEPVSHEDMGRMWETGAAGKIYLDYGVEDRHKTFEGPMLWMYNTHLLAPSASTDSDGQGPTGDPAWDNFRRQFPNMQCAGVQAGHFFVEETPEVIAPRLREFLGM